MCLSFPLESRGFACNGGCLLSTEHLSWFWAGVSLAMSGWISEKGLRDRLILCFYRIEVQRGEAIWPGPHCLRVTFRTFTWHCLWGDQCRPLSLLHTLWTNLIHLWDLSYHVQWWLRAPFLLHPLLSSKPAFPAESWMIPSGCISVTSNSAHPKRISSSLPFSPYILLFLILLSYIMALSA